MVQGVDRATRKKTLSHSPPVGNILENPPPGPEKWCFGEWVTSNSNHCVSLGGNPWTIFAEYTLETPHQVTERAFFRMSILTIKELCRPNGQQWPQEGFFSFFSIYIPLISGNILLSTCLIEYVIFLLTTLNLLLILKLACCFNFIICR